jgi:two-component system OmpR family response regulator
MKLLLVEDELRLQRSLAKALREEHYAVDLAGTGEEGLFKAESVDYDVIILDVMLPVLDGWQVLESLRQHKSTPVLMLTARDASMDRVRGLDLGADDYLIKPFDLAEMLARIRALIRRMAGRAAAVIRLDDIVIDPRSRTVTKADTSVRLTAREFCILEYLAMHRGKTISRTELHDHLLDENEDTLSNLLDVHVYAIRKKLGAQLISTRRGHGYCIA